MGTCTTAGVSERNDTNTPRYNAIGVAGRTGRWRVVVIALSVAVMNLIVGRKRMQWGSARLLVHCTLDDTE